MMFHKDAFLVHILHFYGRQDLSRVTLLFYTSCLPKMYIYVYTLGKREECNKITFISYY